MNLVQLGKGDKQRVVEYSEGHARAENGSIDGLCRHSVNMKMRKLIEEEGWREKSDNHFELA